jgi:hypothetical protein
MEQNTPRNAANDMPFQAGNSRAVGGEQVSVTAVLKAAARAKSGPVERFESQKPAAPTQEEPPASEFQGCLPNPFDDCAGEARDA